MLETVTGLGWGGARQNTQLSKALAELQGLKIEVLAGAGADTDIAVANIEYSDTVLKAIKNDAGTLTDITDTVKIVDRRAKGTLTVADAIADGDIVAVNGKEYTFKVMTVTPSTNVKPYVVPITLKDEEGAAANLAKAIMSGDANVVAEANAAVVTVTWRTPGVAGNAITMSDAKSNAHVTKSGAVLSGGQAATAIQSSGDTTAKQVLLFWYKKG